MGKKKRKKPGTEATVSERRQHTRGLPQDLQIDVYVQDDQHTASARNLSEGGAFIQGGPPMAVGDEVIVSLQPSMDEPVYLLRAEVRGVQAEGQTAGMGVRFIEPESDLVAACRSVVQPATR